MKRRVLVVLSLANPLRRIIPIILVALACPAFNVVGQTETNVNLGPMPAEASLPDPLGRRIVGDMRSWVQSFKPDDAKVLNSIGTIVFSWEQLKASYPEQARMVDDYVEQRRMSIVEAFKKDAHPIPNRLAVHHTPDSVAIERLAHGHYRVVISSKEGIEHLYLEIS